MFIITVLKIRIQLNEKYQDQANTTVSKPSIKQAINTGQNSKVPVAEKFLHPKLQDLTFPKEREFQVQVYILQKAFR